jgi:F420-dependent oxidoreductase-like protein
VRYAIKTIPQDTTWDGMLGVWQAADEIELFESAWNFDHFYPIFGDSSGPCFEGWSMVAAMATATRRIRIGCQVSGMHYRHPAVLANMAATIDVISGGRLEIGLGAGWNEEESGAYGIPLGTLRERFDRFDEGLDVIVGLLSQETTTYDGAYFQLTDARCEPKPVQRPHPPITIGGNGPTRTLRAAARHAQQWNSTIADPAQWRETKAILQQRCDEIGRDVTEITCSVNIRHAEGQDPRKTAELAAAAADAGADLAVVTFRAPHDGAVVEPIAEALRDL